MTGPQPCAPGELFAGRYRVERPLARGGMGIVFLAVQEPLGRPVAIKVLQERGLDDSFRERFFAEAKISASLSHPNVVTLLDYGEAPNGALYMVLEYVEGETLDRILGRQIRLEPTRLIGLLRQVAAGLHHAHRSGIVHRDLKPGNLIVRTSPEGEQIKVLDFGIAKVRTGGSEARDDLTEASRVLGTPRFMAPEQIRKGDLDGRTDLYALGIIAYLMASGRPPFQADNDTALMNHHLSTPPPDLGERAVVYPELDFVIRRLLAKRPQDRPQDAAALIEELDAAERSLSLAPVYVDEATPPAVDVRLEAVGRPKTRRLAPVLWSAAAAAAALLLGVWLVRPTAWIEPLPPDPPSRVAAPESARQQRGPGGPELKAAAAPAAPDPKSDPPAAGATTEAPAPGPEPPVRRRRSTAPVSAGPRESAESAEFGGSRPSTAPSPSKTRTSPQPSDGVARQAGEDEARHEANSGEESTPESQSPEASETPERPPLLLPDLERGKSRVPVVE